MDCLENILIIVNVILFLYIVYNLCLNIEVFHDHPDGTVHNHYEDNNAYDRNLGWCGGLSCGATSVLPGAIGSTGTLPGTAIAGPIPII